ncbi:MAG: rhomboid family intramembrane serine protease [Candidatus Altiarchaeota archaeon]
MRIFGFRIRVVETLISLNALMFLFRMIFPTTAFTLFALQPATVLAMPWTLVTSMFLHADLMHIFFNMMALYFFGTYLENLEGERNLLKLYFIGGICGSIAYTASSLLFGVPNPESIAIGASGAVFAIAGALAVLQPNTKVVMLPLFIPMPLWIAVFGFMVLLSFMPGVAWQGHLGGLLIGVLYGYRWRKKVVEIVAVHEKYGYKFY